VATAHPGTLNTATAGRLFFVQDIISSKKLLVDTGSTYSIFPFRSKAKPFGQRLKVANGQLIRCGGSRHRELRIASRAYQWQFLQTNVSLPILGVDFLREFGLLVDVAGEQLVPRGPVVGSAANGGQVFAVLQQPSQCPPAPAAGGPGPLSGEAGSSTLISSYPNLSGT
jgi:hypothetical protein